MEITNVVIEKIKPPETQFALSMLHELYSELGEEGESIDFLDAALLERLLQSARTEIYLAKSDAGVVGIMTLTESQSFYAGGRYGCIDEMYVVPAFRSSEIGSALLDKAIETAKIRGWKRIDVTAPTEEKWIRTTEFYVNSGFVFTGPKYKLKL